MRFYSKKFSQVFRFWFSLLSKKTKRFIILLQVFGDKLAIRVETRVRIELGSLLLKIGYFNEYIEMWYKDPENSGCFVTNKWRSPGITSRQWIDHCLELTGSNSVDNLSIFAYDRGFDMNACYRNLTGLHFSNLHLSGDYLPDIQMFGGLPDVDTICFSFSLKPNYQQIIVRNLDKFTVENSDGADGQLNNLLASNASFIKLTEMTLSSNQINLFLKHWIAGSNEMLRGFMLEQLEAYNVQSIFNGLDYQPSVREHHGVKENNLYLHPHTQKFDITRNDGMRATFYWALGWEQRHVINSLCCMFVWDKFMEDE